MSDGTRMDWLWTADSPAAAALRAVLRPAEAIYAGITAGRGSLYDRGILRTHAAPVPALSIGNLTVGGTGKTPIAAWAAAELAVRGANPVVVLRGYGGEEPEVHARLNPGIPVIVGPDRVAGLLLARARGADVAVLDDAFQHRRAARTQDWVLVSADRWTGRERLLPAGPWREPIDALKRASLAVITRKAIDASGAERVARELRSRVPGLAVAIIRLAADALRRPDDGASQPLSTLRGARVLLVAAIGDPRALRAQLEAEGATVRPRIYADHHAFTAAEVAAIARDVAPGEIVICTLKDAVKVASWWPRAAPALWYVSQRVEVEEGRDLLQASLDTVLRARPARSDAAGQPRSFL